VTVAAVVLAVLAIGLAGAAWRADAGSGQQRLLTVAMAVALTAMAVLVLVAGPAGAWGSAGSRVLLVLLAALAVAGGGPLAVAVLGVADRHPALERVGAAGEAEVPADTDEFGPVAESEGREDGEVLRGGAWIGTLERLGIFASLAAGWPGGVAVVLAVKGVGRYQELGQTGAAERFIIGTFASVLWACACAGVWWYG